MSIECMSRPVLIQGHRQLGESVSLVPSLAGSQFPPEPMPPRGPRPATSYRHLHRAGFDRSLSPEREDPRVSRALHAGQLKTARCVTLLRSIVWKMPKKKIPGDPTVNFVPLGLAST